MAAAKPYRRAAPCDAQTRRSPCIETNVSQSGEHQGDAHSSVSQTCYAMSGTTAFTNEIRIFVRSAPERATISEQTVPRFATATRARNQPTRKPGCRRPNRGNDPKVAKRKVAKIRARATRQARSTKRCQTQVIRENSGGNQAVFQKPQAPVDQIGAARCCPVFAKGCWMSAGSCSRGSADAPSAAEATGAGPAAAEASSHAMAKPAARAARRRRSLFIAFAHFRPEGHKPVSPYRMMQK